MFEGKGRKSGSVRGDTGGNVDQQKIMEMQDREFETRCREIVRVEDWERLE